MHHFLELLGGGISNGIFLIRIMVLKSKIQHALYGDKAKRFLLRWAREEHTA